MDSKYIYDVILPELHDINQVIKQLQKRKREIEKQDPQIKIYYNGYKVVAEPYKYNINFGELYQQSIHEQ
jgi:hypothetical protein